MASRIASAFVLVLLCLAMFDVPSALVVSRGYSPWLALIVGAATFPIVPLAWHVIGERKRRAPGGTTSAWTRLLHRTLVIGAIASATVVAAARTQVWTAMRDHALWFFPGRAVWFAGDPPHLGSHAMCEAFATMESKCEKGTSFHNAMALCKMATEFDRDNAVQFTSSVSVAEQCAIKTSSCDDYHACQDGR